MHSFSMNFILMLFGLVFSCIYCLLAGWDDVAFGVGIVASPLALYVWCISGHHANIIQPVHENLVSRNALKSFFILSFWLSLPIILRIIAILFEKIGYQEISMNLYFHRYLSIIYFYIFLYSVSVFCEYIKDLLNKINNLFFRIKSSRKKVY